MGPTSTCYACGAANLTLLEDVRDVHAGTHRLYRLQCCNECGSTELMDRLTDAELAQIYPEDYYSYVPQKDRLAFLKRLLGATYRRHRYVPKFTRLLEIGCGRGEFLARIKHLGSVVGLERSLAARDAARELGVDVRVGDVEDASLFEENAFDCVYLNHSFEHLSDPNGALASTRKWLVPGGTLFIGIPNVAGAVARVFGKNWFYLGPPLHVTNGTPQGMKALLERNGFAVERVFYNSDPVSIPMSVHIAFGGTVQSIPAPAKLMIGATTLLCAPLSWSLDAIRSGDCMEMVARNVA